MSFKSINLNVNLGDMKAFARVGQECNDGGSTICWSPTDCARKPMSCVTTSTRPPRVKAAQSDELEQLHAELAQVLSKFAAQAGGEAESSED
jgi:hypothetical protein